MDVIIVADYFNFFANDLLVVLDMLSTFTIEITNYIVRVVRGARLLSKSK